MLWRRRRTEVMSVFASVPAPRMARSATSVTWSPPTDMRFSRSTGRWARRVGRGSSASRRWRYSRVERHAGREVEQEDVLLRRGQELLELAVGDERAGAELAVVPVRGEHRGADDAHRDRGVADADRDGVADVGVDVGEGLRADEQLARARGARPSIIAGSDVALHDRHREGVDPPVLEIDLDDGAGGGPRDVVVGPQRGDHELPDRGQRGRAGLDVPGPPVEARGVEDALEARPEADRRDQQRDGEREARRPRSNRGRRRSRARPRGRS